MAHNKKKDSKTGRAKPKVRPDKAKRPVIPPKKIPRRPPDVSEAERLRSLAAPRPVAFGVNPNTTLESRRLDSVLQVKTEDQRAIEACAACYTRLAETHPRVAQTVGSMIGIRRIYAVALRELQEALAEAGEDVPVEMVDFCVGLAMYRASEAFDEHELMQGVADTILPWLASTVDKHTISAHAEAVAERARINEERKARPLPVGFRHSVHQASDTLRRDRSLILAGWRNAVLWLLDHACEQVLAATWGANVVRMVHTSPRPEDQHAHLVRLAPNAWVGCANSDMRIDHMVAQYVSPAVGGPVDLVVCDDLQVVYTLGFTGRPGPANAGDGHRRLRKWCDKMGAGFLGAIGYVAREAPDVSGPEYEQLRTHADVRQVAVADTGDDKYLVTAGNHAMTISIPKAELDAYGSTLVVPGQ